MIKRISTQLILAFLGLAFLGIWACSSDSGSTPVTPTAKILTVDVSSIEFLTAGNSASVTVTSTADAWTISSSDSSWIQISKSSGIAGSTSVSITATANTTTVARSATITVSSSQATPVQIAVTQPATVIIPPVTDLYPSYNTNPIAADATGMSSTAVQLAAKIKLGWNIGNSLEATGGETAWGNPKITKALIDLVKANGFNAIRIPCSWNQNMANSSTAQIKADWLARVKEVVQYCVDNDMYVLVNIHWDGGWLQDNVNEASKVANNAKQKAFWEQIATSLRDFDEHLLFASANEPSVSDATQMDVLTSYHQTFIDAVRATGGKNAYRTLVIQGPTTDITKTNKLMLTLPTDKVVSRMMVEVHYYTPWNFCGLTADASWGNMFYYWGNSYHSTTDTGRNATWGEETAVSDDFKLMKTQFVDKGIPVVLGEFGAIRRTTLTGSNLTLHLASRAYYLKYVVQQAKLNGLLPFYWDEGNIGDKGFGIFKRSDNTVFDSQALTGLLDGLK